MNPLSNVTAPRGPLRMSCALSQGTVGVLNATVGVSSDPLALDARAEMLPILISAHGQVMPWTCASVNFVNYRRRPVLTAVWMGDGKGKWQLCMRFFNNGTVFLISANMHASTFPFLNQGGPATHTKTCNAETSTTDDLTCRLSMFSSHL